LASNLQWLCHEVTPQHAAMSTLAVIRKKAERTASPEAARHPCFDPKARAAWARVHLPVAPACNISCNFCDRRFDCTNESRPGVTSVVLAPWQALAYLDGLMQRRQDVAVVGIAGPGDPLANPGATLETLRLVRAQYPDLLLCLATNGLALAAHAAELQRLHLSHLTITINTLDPATGARIYAWVRDGERVLRGEDGAALLLQRQLAALEALRGTGILIKVNSILIPGINDEQIAGIAAEVKRRGAHLFNCVALIPAARTPFASLPAPDPAMVSRVRAAAGAHLPLMEHCSRCRADACGLLNEGTAEISLTALRAAANLPHPVEAPVRPYIAVATREGLLINDHLGEAESFAVFAPEGSGFRLVENRVAPPAGTGVERWRDLAAGLADCKVVLVAGVGPAPRRTLESSGLRVVEAEGLIEDALEPLFRDSPLPASMARRFESCGNGCGGTGQGCG
jgi:nitrogen fixation protein NifB